MLPVGKVKLVFHSKESWKFARMFHSLRNKAVREPAEAPDMGLSDGNTAEEALMFMALHVQ